MNTHNKALWSEYFTVAWNILEGIVAIAAGVAAGSIALVGFGLDSYIEVASGSVLIWRLRKHGFAEKDDEVAAEKRAILFVGTTFFALALYVVYESGKKLLIHERPQESFIGIILAIASLITMPLLANYKNKLAMQIGSIPSPSSMYWRICRSARGRYSTPSAP